MIKYVYEFTNQRKLTKTEFLRWFQKKVLYTIRKFKMIQNNDIVFYENKKDFRGVVLEDVLKMFAEKGNVEIIKSPHPNSAIEKSLLIKKDSRFPITSPTPKKLLTKKLKLTRSNKIAISSTTDTESDKLIHELIKGKANNLKELAPVQGKIIKPLYLFLDKEVLLYAKLKKLKYTLLPNGMTSDYGGLGVPQGGARTSSRPQSTELGGKDNISNFIDELEKKHPEIKQAMINSMLKLMRFNTILSI